jgi:hypothetical protein
MGALGGIAFALVASILLPQNTLRISLLLAIATWLVVSSALWYLRRHHPWVRSDRTH